MFGETELSRAYLGVTVGRHPALCDRVIDDPGISRRHLRVGITEGRLFAEDLNSLNGTVLDGEEIPPFQPVPLSPDQVLTLGERGAHRVAAVRRGALMRRPNREISIFTLSALDVLAMSAGVFVLLLVMLMPYHRKVLDAHAAIEAVRIAEAETVAHVQTLEEQGTLHRAEADAAEAEAAAVLAQAASLRQAAAEQRQEVLRQAVASQVQEGDVTTPVIDAIDLVFVIDTTASMGPVLREVAHSLRGIVRILERLVPSLRVGVVAYNDRDTGRIPVVTLPPTPTDHGLARVVAFIEGLSASTVGSRTVDEDLYLGLTTATALPLRPEAKQALVVVGDAEAHPHEQAQALFRAESFVRGRDNRSISTLFVTTPSSLLHGNVARGFFVALANAGGGSFTDHAGSMIEGVLLSVFVD